MKSTLLPVVVLLLPGALFVWVAGVRIVVYSHYPAPPDTVPKLWLFGMLTILHLLKVHMPCGRGKVTATAKAATGHVWMPRSCKQFFEWF